jgi:predicted nucleic acid-binding protein
MKHFLVDTNIVLDLLLERKPHANKAARIFDLAERGKIRLCISSFSYNTLYYILRKVLTHKDTVRILGALHEITQTLDTKDEAVAASLTSTFADFEDALQYYSAVGTKNMAGIITRNGKDFKHSKLLVLSPEEVLAISL